MIEPTTDNPIFVDCDDGDNPNQYELEELAADTERSKHGVKFDVEEINDSRDDTITSNASFISITSVSSNGTMDKLKRLKSRLKLKDLSQNELELKASLYFHICNPLKRWKVEKLVPYKLVLQIVKTMLLVAQVILFMYISANERAVFVLQSNFLFQELFIKSYSSAKATPSNHYLARTRNVILDEITYNVEQYYNLPNLTTGSFGYVLNDSGNGPLPIQAKATQYKVAELDPSRGKYKIDFTMETYQFILQSENVSGLSVTDQLAINGVDITFSQKVHLELKFFIRSIRISNQNTLSRTEPDCYVFDNTIVYSNSEHYGGVDYYLHSEIENFDCQGELLSKSHSYTVFIVIVTILDLVIITLCIISICFTSHTYKRAYNLGKAMGDFYLYKLRITLSWWERKSLFSVWSVFTFFSDVLLILGTFLKILLQFDVLLDTTSVQILIGTALIVQAGALMRYFSFFKQLNALTRTLSAAYPELLKFLLCTSLLYFAFALSGLVVFRSYGELFGSFGNSVETLFALINGDSIWLVFRAFDSQDTAVYVYSRFFVYVFIFLFIYAVLNLFTSLVKTSYDESTNIDRATINEVRRFVFSGPLTPTGVALRDVTHVDKYVDPKVILCRKRRRHRKQSIGDLD